MSVFLIVGSISLSCNSQEPNDLKYHKTIIEKETFNNNSKYNEEDCEDYNKDCENYNKKHNEEYNEKYNRKHNEEYNEKYNEKYNKKYNEKDNEKGSNKDSENSNKKDSENGNKDNSEEFDSKYINFGLQLFQIKNEYNISEAIFNKILKTLKIFRVTLYRLQKLLGNLVPFKPKL
ncbi:2040_t:CDS:2, partial [Cetraspora pellucida]